MNDVLAGWLLLIVLSSLCIVVGICFRCFVVISLMCLDGVIVSMLMCC